jgi:hypothetical protein
MTYREIAAARGITHAAAIRLVQRHRWQKREGSNDGLAHVLVPHDAVQPTPPVGRPRRANPASPSSRPATFPDTDAFETALAAIEGAHVGEIVVLQEQADTAERARTAAQALADQALATVAQLTARMDTAVSIADRATSMAADAVARADRSEAAIAGERARADAMRDRVAVREADLALIRAALDQTQAEARKAHAEVETLRRADAEREARGLVARLRAAWRGE